MLQIASNFDQPHQNKNEISRLHQYCYTPLHQLLIGLMSITPGHMHRDMLLIGRPDESNCLNCFPVLLLQDSSKTHRVALTSNELVSLACWTPNCQLLLFAVSFQGFTDRVY